MAKKISTKQVYGAIVSNHTLLFVSTDKQKVLRELAKHPNKEITSLFRCSGRNGYLEVNLYDQKCNPTNAHVCAIKRWLGPIVLHGQDLNSLSKSEIQIL